MKKRVQIVIFSCLFIMITMGFLTAGVLRFDADKPAAFENLYGIPLAFSVCALGVLLLLKKFYSCISILGIVAIYFIKDVVVLLFLMLGNYEILATNSDILEYMDQAVWFMIYETVCSFITLVIFGGTSKASLRKDRMGTIKEGFLFKLMILIILVSVLCILLIYPSLSGRFHTIFDIRESEKYIPVRSWRVAGSEPLGIIDTLMRSFVSLLQIIFPIYVIGLAAKRFGQSNPGRMIAIALLVTISLFFVMTGENANTVFSATAILTVISILYFKQIRNILPLVMIIASVVLGTALFTKGRNSDVITFQDISKTLNAYFCGPVNVAGACYLKKNGDDIFILTDFIRSLPYISSLFKGILGEGSVSAFNTAFWGIPGRKDQLLPSIGQGMLYFGYILAPIIPVFFVYLTIKFESLARKAKNIYIAYFYYYSMLLMIMVTAGNNMVHFYRYAVRMGIVYGIFWLMKVRFTKEKVTFLKGNSAA